MVFAIHFIQALKTFYDSITCCCQYLHGRVLSAGAGHAGCWRYKFIFHPDIKAGVHSLVLPVLALGVAIAPQLGVDADPGLGAQEVVWVGTRCTVAKADRWLPEEKKFYHQFSIVKYSYLPTDTFRKYVEMHVT